MTPLLWDFGRGERMALRITLKRGIERKEKTGFKWKRRGRRCSLRWESGLTWKRRGREASLRCLKWYFCVNRPHKPKPSSTRYIDSILGTSVRWHVISYSPQLILLQSGWRSTSRLPVQLCWYFSRNSIPRISSLHHLLGALSADRRCEQAPRGIHSR